VACCAIGMCLASCGLSSGGTPVNYQAGDDQNGHALTLHPGQTLLVTLASTYWTFEGSSDPQVLAAVGTPAVAPATCGVAGSGCGTVSQEFRALEPGTAQVTASRVSCGEAMACTGASGHYLLSVQVVALSGSQQSGLRSSPPGVGTARSEKFQPMFARF
jgi:hypothetical protein